MSVPSFYLDEQPDNQHSLYVPYTQTGKMIDLRPEDTSTKNTRFSVMLTK